MKESEDKKERTIIIPITENIHLNSRASDYLDVQIEVLTDSKSGFDDIDADPNTEYLNVRIEVEPNSSVQPLTPTKLSNCESLKYPHVKLLAKNFSSSLKKIHFNRTEPLPPNNCKPFECDSCGKNFTTKQHLERHSNLHSMETLYPCPECDKVLLDKSYLLRHIRVHAGVKPFACNTCQKKFRTACSLKRHETTHDPGSRPYVCSDCDKRFPDRSSLKKHSRTHNGVKTHVCIICAKGFCHVGDYNLHLKGHDIVKQYHCDQCGKEFARQNNLMRHKAVHTSDSNFQCIICKGRFQHASTLTRHILSCHPEAARVKKKKPRLADTQVATNTLPESTDHEEEVTVQVSADAVQNASGNDISVQGLAKAIPLCHVPDNLAIIDKVTAIGLDRCEENFGDALKGDKNTDPPQNVTLSSSSFEIFQFDARGTLVRMTDTMPFQEMNACSNLGDQPDVLKKPR